jgi:hypothetical protein
MKNKFEKFEKFSLTKEQQCLFKGGLGDYTGSACDCQRDCAGFGYEVKLYQPGYCQCDLAKPVGFADPACGG